MSAANATTINRCAPNTFTNIVLFILPVYILYHVDF